MFDKIVHLVNTQLKNLVRVRPGREKENTGFQNKIKSSQINEN
jgi:hypothetical protein